MSFASIFATLVGALIFAFAVPAAFSASPGYNEDPGPGGCGPLVYVCPTPWWNPFENDCYYTDRCGNRW